MLFDPATGPAVGHVDAHELGDGTGMAALLRPTRARHITTSADLSINGPIAGEASRSAVGGGTHSAFGTGNVSNSTPLPAAPTTIPRALPPDGRRTE